MGQLLRASPAHAESQRACRDLRRGRAYSMSPGKRQRRRDTPRRAQQPPVLKQVADPGPRHTRCCGIRRPTLSIPIAWDGSSPCLLRRPRPHNRISISEVTFGGATPVAPVLYTPHLQCFAGSGFGSRLRARYWSRRGAPCTRGACGRGSPRRRCRARVSAHHQLADH